MSRGPGRAGIFDFSRGIKTPMKPRLWSLRGNARMFVARGFSHDVNVAD
jgi:hypothetical protein